MRCSVVWFSAVCIFASAIEGSAGEEGDCAPTDLSCDGSVDTDDFGIFINSFQLSPQGGPPFAPGDFDEDGDVDIDDFGVIVAGFQNSFSTIVAGENSGGVSQLSLPGDFDGDGDLDLDDFGVFVSQYQIGETGGPPFVMGDFDEDGDVDVDDFGVFVNSYQTFPPPAVSVPEPGALALLAAGWVAASRGRRGRGEPDF